MKQTIYNDIAFTLAFLIYFGVLFGIWKLISIELAVIFGIAWVIAMIGKQNLPSSTPRIVGYGKRK